MITGMKQTFVEFIFTLLGYRRLLALYECWAFRTSAFCRIVLKIGEFGYAKLFGILVRESVLQKVNLSSPVAENLTFSFRLIRSEAELSTGKMKKSSGVTAGDSSKLTFSHTCLT